MIVDHWVFADERPPDRVFHRHAEIEQLLRSLEPVTDGDRAEDVLIYGPSGVGKTTTAKHVLKNRIPYDHTDWTIVNSSKTRAGILHEAIIKHPTDTAVAPNTAADELAATLRRVVDRPYVVILDEADTIRDLSVLRDLYEVPTLSVVAIVHNHREWLARLDQELQEFFSMRSQIEFQRYTTTELVDILEPRVEHGLEPDSITTDQLEWVADEVAGVARYGIQSVLAAAELAVERNHDRVREVDVRDGFDRARAKMRESNLRSLPFGPCVVYELLRLEGSGDWIAGTHIQDRYEDLGDRLYADRNQDPVSRRQVRNYLEKLQEYNLIEGRNETCWREYRVVDSALEAPIEIKLTVK